MPKTEWKGAALLAPVPPALVSCGTLEAPNALAVAWTGILNSQPPKTYISVRPERYSYGLIKESGEFIINLPTAALVRAVDYCGVKAAAMETSWPLPASRPRPCPALPRPPLRKARSALRAVWRILCRLARMTCFWRISSAYRWTKPSLTRTAACALPRPGCVPMRTANISHWDAK